jgi:hypothetical protein
MFGVFQLNPCMRHYALHAENADIAAAGNAKVNDLRRKAVAHGHPVGAGFNQLIKWLAQKSPEGVECLYGNVRLLAYREIHVGAGASDLRYGNGTESAEDACGLAGEQKYAVCAGRVGYGLACKFDNNTVERQASQCILDLTENADWTGKGLNAHCQGDGCEAKKLFHASSIMGLLDSTRTLSRQAIYVFLLNDR